MKRNIKFLNSYFTEQIVTVQKKPISGTTLSEVWVKELWVVLPCILVWNMKWFTNFIQLSIYLCSFSSTCFGLIRPSSGAIDVTVSYICSIWYPWCSEVSVLGMWVLVACCSTTRHQHTNSSGPTPYYTKDTICCICKKL